LKIEQGKEFTVPMDLEKQPSFILSDCCIPSGSLYINDDTFRKINLKQYHSQIGSIIHGETPFESIGNITFNDPSVAAKIFDGQLMA
jgi:hypothetical protein